ncbi:Lactate utilization protein A [bacterium HR36]|nr:Lactate utilization protein A [bacterium HR36]
MRVALMVTCLGDVFFPQVGWATVRLLEKLGVEVDFPQRQTCCGQPHFNSGHWEDARVLAQHTLRVFAEADYVVIPSGSCAAMVKLEYPELFRDRPRLHAQALAVARKTWELAAFLIEVLHCEDVGACLPGKAVYHMACHLRPLGAGEYPLRLLRRVRGLQLLALERHDECCGFGGSFSVRFPEISAAMVRDKCRCIEESGADYVISTDAGCLMNIGGYLRRHHSRVRTLHLAEVLVADGAHT